MILIKLLSSDTSDFTHKIKCPLGGYVEPILTVVEGGGYLRMPGAQILEISQTDYFKCSTLCFSPDSKCCNFKRVALTLVCEPQSHFASVATFPALWSMSCAVIQFLTVLLLVGLESGETLEWMLQKVLEFFSTTGTSSRPEKQLSVKCWHFVTPDYKWAKICDKSMTLWSKHWLEEMPSCSSTMQISLIYLGLSVLPWVCASHLVPPKQNSSLCLLTWLLQPVWRFKSEPRWRPCLCPRPHFLLSPSSCLASSLINCWILFLDFFFVDSSKNLSGNYKSGRLLHILPGGLKLSFSGSKFLFLLPPSSGEMRRK